MKPNNDINILLFLNLFTVISPICEETGIRPSWLLWLCITLGILFLIMLLMNIFLCTAMSCSCARTEVSFLENKNRLNEFRMNFFDVSLLAIDY